MKWASCRMHETLPKAVQGLIAPDELRMVGTHRLPHQPGLPAAEGALAATEKMLTDGWDCVKRTHKSAEQSNCILHSQSSRSGTEHAQQGTDSHG